MLDLREPFLRDVGEADRVTDAEADKNDVRVWIGQRPTTQDKMHVN